MKKNKCGLIFVAILNLGGVAGAQAQTKWAASWATAMQAALTRLPTEGAAIPAYTQQPDLSIPFPSGYANNQTFRTIIKPDLYGPQSRIKISNAFGTQPDSFSAVSIALQQYQANIVPGTSASVTFSGGSRSVTLKAGEEIYSDPIVLNFVGDINTQSFKGSNLAVSYTVSGSSGPMTYHDAAFSTNYISPPNSGDQTRSVNADAFPYTTTSNFFLSEYDVQAPSSTRVIVAFGDSITDGTFSTLNGYDRWSNSMSDALHAVYGSAVSVVNEGIEGNKVAMDAIGQSAINRLSRDVLGLAGVNVVVWLEGINDIGQGASATQVISGYQSVLNTLHNNNIKVVGGTVTSSYPPGGQIPSNSPLVALIQSGAAGYASSQANAARMQLNNFILSSRSYDAVADFSAVTTDPATGSLYQQFVPNSEGSAGDYLHLNRAGYQVMGKTAAQAVYPLLRR